MMNTILVAGYTLQDAILVLGIGVGLFIFFSILKKIFSKEKVNPHMQFATCKSCDWQGLVSLHAGRCPGCNQPLGDRKLSQASTDGDHIVNH
jgi:hypothetical protein